MNRKSLLGSLGTGAAALAMPGLAFAADDAVNVGIMALDSAMESNYAAKIGFADQAHLKLAIEAMSNGAAVMAAVAGKAVNVGAVNIFSVLQARDRGLPIVMVASAALYNTKFPTAALLVPKDSPLRTGADLNGKTMAVDGLKNMAQVSAMAWADKNGGDSTKIKFVEMPMPDMQIALATKRIDIAEMSEPWASRSAKADARIFASVYDGIATSWLQNAWVANADWVTANVDVARRFRALVYKTAGWANTHQAQSADILSDFTKVNIDVIHATPRAHYAERDSIELLDPVVDAAMKYGLIAKRPDPRQLFAPELRG